MTMIGTLCTLFCSLGAVIYAQAPVVCSSQTNAKKLKTGACDFGTFVEQAIKLQSHREKRLLSARPEWKSVRTNKAMHPRRQSLANFNNSFLSATWVIANVIWLKGNT